MSNGGSLEEATLGTPDWIELKNNGSSPVSLFGYRITDNIQNTDKAFVFPDLVLEAGEYLVIYATKEFKTDMLAYEGGPICLGFSLKSAGETLVLENANMQLVQELMVPALERDISYARRDDGTYGYCSDPTPNSQNHTKIYYSLSEIPMDERTSRVETTPVQGIIFSEISARNNTVLVCSGCERCDWVELFNQTDRDISLTGFALTDDPDDYDKPNLDAVLSAGGYLLIQCCEESCDASDGHLCVELGINRYGDHLYLFDSNGLLSAEITIPETIKKDMSYMRDSDGTYCFTITPTPNAVNIYTEYIEEPEEDPVPVFKGLACPVVINEVLPSNQLSVADRDGDRSDWIELFNQTDSSISLSGWFLSDGKDFEKWPFPDVSISAHGYLLVFADTKESSANELHANFSVSEGETITLFCSSDNIYDKLTIESSLSNVSMGRDADGTVVFYREPTPSAPNGEAKAEASASGYFNPKGVFISEVCASHEYGSEEDDWIELYNGGSKAVSLDGCYLTDSFDEPTKYRIGKLSIGPGKYAVISVSSKNGAFNISPSGETIYLIRENGTGIIDYFETGVQSQGMSSGRLENDPSIRRVFFLKPTKGKKNTSAYKTGYTSDPIFSETAIYQTSPFQLSLSCLQPDAVIYYTTDGSEPSEQSKRFTAPIAVSGNTVIRAYAVAPGLLDSKVITYTYLFEEPHTVPVMCLSLEPGSFRKIYNITKRAEITEAVCSVTYYEADGKIGVSFPCGIRAKGRSTLRLNQKAMQLTLRGRYGRDSIVYPFFEQAPKGLAYRSLCLRCGGQDALFAIMRDPLVSGAARETHVISSETRPVVVYVNAVYYGLYFLGEEMNADYFVTHFGTEKSGLDIISQERSASHGSMNAFISLKKQVQKANLSKESAYAALCKSIDIDAFTDYLAIRILTGDGDLFNQKLAGTSDGSFLWMPILFDNDRSYDRIGIDVMNDYFLKALFEDGNGGTAGNTFFLALYQNDSWREKLLRRIVELVCGPYSEESLCAAVDRLEKQMEPEMKREINRWHMLKTVAEWKEQVSMLKRKIHFRNTIVLSQLPKYFNISERDLNAMIAQYEGNPVN